ncbi:MAG TPA: AI-2E family transporter [Candidatus Moranbacteria bacterium]|nr:AI-2E family transporter [Candidatus Moranbacteria bacterium]
MKTNLNSAFLLILIVLAGICAYLVFKPFLVALFLAFIISQLFRKWYEKINRKFGNRPSLASLTLCIILFFILVIPFLITGSLVANEVANLYQTVQKTDWQSQLNSLSNSPALKILGIDIAKDFNLQNAVAQNSSTIIPGIKNISNFAFSIIGKIYVSTSSFIFMTFVVFFSLYYLFKDGDAIIKKIMALSPLRNNEEGQLLKNFIAISKATLKGSLVIAIIQGILMALIFWVTGVESPVLWGSITIVVALIPLLGAALIWFPVGLIMLFLGNIWQALVIMIFGALVISLIDNILRPKLVGKETSLHPLLVFFSTIGGIALFGLVGILLGPVIVVLLISLLDIYQIEFKNELEKMNQ